MFGFCGSAERKETGFRFPALAIALIAASLARAPAFAQDEEYIPPPQPSPETGEMVRVPEDEDWTPPPRPASPAAPRPAPRVSPPRAPSPEPEPEPVKKSPERPVRTKAPTTASKPAASKPASKGQRGVVIADPATVFRTPDFEGEVIATLSPGKIYTISRGKKGPFYRIRVKSGMTGWITDAEIRPIGGSAVSTPAPKDSKKETAKEAAAPPRKMKPINKTAYRGLGLEFINFSEDTMGAVRTASLPFYGFRVTGPDTIMAGEMYMDGSVLLHSGAPSYYEDATGNSAGGFILIGNFMFVTDIPQSRDVMASYGFGPTFRFSQFNATLDNDPSAGKSKSYSLTDATIGAVFGVGVAVAVGERYAVRLDGKYYWEASRYTSFGLAFQMDF